MSDTDKTVTVRLAGVTYSWHKQNWVTSHNNLTVSTALAQKLTGIALHQNLLTKEDCVAEKKTK